MRILELIPTLKVGGAETFVVNITNAFAANGNECEVVTLFDVDDGDFLAQRLDAKISLISLDKAKGFDFKCLCNVVRAIKKYKPDIVHAHIGAISYLLLAVIFYRHCKYFATIHSEANREAGGILTKTIRKILFKLKLVIPVTISKESMLSFEKLYVMTPDMICNGVPEVEVIAGEDYDKLVFIHPASCQPIKNQVLLFKAFSELAQQNTNVELHWFGDHSQYETLFNELSSLFGDKIIYKGVTQDVRKYLKNARAMCLSSIMEGMPMTIIEAMSVGCIPIATPVGGCINMIEDNVNGFLSADMSTEAYYEVLKKAATISDEELNKMRKSARNTYEQKYTIDKTALEYINLFTHR